MQSVCSSELPDSGPILAGITDRVRCPCEYQIRLLP
jgi:hypothetical protein